MQRSIVYFSIKDRIFTIESRFWDMSLALMCEMSHPWRKCFEIKKPRWMNIVWPPRTLEYLFNKKNNRKDRFLTIFHEIWRDSLSLLCKSMDSGCINQTKTSPMLLSWDFRGNMYSPALLKLLRCTRNGQFMKARPSSISYLVFPY